MSTDTKKLDALAMVRRINRLVNVDAGETWSWKAAEHRPFTQEESEEMASIIGSVFMVAHCVTCSACAPRWFKQRGETHDGTKEESNGRT